MAEATPKAPKKTAAKPAKTDTVAAKIEPKKAAPAKAVAKKAAPAAVASKPVAEKKPAAAKKPAAPKTAAPRKPATKKTATTARGISDEQRYRMIAEAAYYRAESCQFKSDPLRDWIEAERDIAALLSEGA